MLKNAFIAKVLSTFLLLSLPLPAATYHEEDYNVPPVFDGYEYANSCCYEQPASLICLSPCKTALIVGGGILLGAAAGFASNKMGGHGHKGEKGSPGPTGTLGATGTVGFEGDEGEEGAQGDNGPTGPAGTNGPTGSSGDLGPSGPSGPSGSAGPTGATGAGFSADLGQSLTFHIPYSGVYVSQNGGAIPQAPIDYLEVVGFVSAPDGVVLEQNKLVPIVLGASFGTFNFDFTVQNPVFGTYTFGVSVNQPAPALIVFEFGKNPTVEASRDSSTTTYDFIEIINVIPQEFQLSHDFTYGETNVP